MVVCGGLAWCVVVWWGGCVWQCFVCMMLCVVVGSGLLGVWWSAVVINYVLVCVRVVCGGAW